MKPSPKDRKLSNSETGQIPRDLLEAHHQANMAARETDEGEDANSITGVFHLGRGVDGRDTRKERSDSPQSGGTAEPAQQ